MTQPNNPLPLYPLTFVPVFKDYPWGGRNLERFGRRLPPGIVAESWDIAGHPNGSSVIRSGPLAGMTLTETMAELGLALVGERSQAALEAGKFPLLIKLLDAHAWLSVQVHPDDAYGLAHEGEWGKTEMWVALYAEPGAELIYGFKPGVTRSRFAQEIAAGRAGELLHRMPVREGDVIFLPAGAVHALGPGVVVAEVQQNSDTTYRIYDWGRPRPLHIEQALDVLNFDLVEPGPTLPVLMLEDDGMKVELLVSCKYFQAERLTLPSDGQFFGLCEGESFEIFGVLRGSVSIQWEGAPVELNSVDWALIPADLGEFQVCAEERSTVLRIFVP